MNINPKIFLRCISGEKVLIEMLCGYKLEGVVEKAGDDMNITLTNAHQYCKGMQTGWYLGILIEFVN